MIIDNDYVPFVIFGKKTKANVQCTQHIGPTLFLFIDDKAEVQLNIYTLKQIKAQKRET